MPRSASRNATDFRLYSTVNRRRVAFATTSIAGPPRPCSSALIALQSCLALDSKLGYCQELWIGRSGDVPFWECDEHPEDPGRKTGEKGTPPMRNGITAEAGPGPELSGDVTLDDLAREGARRLIEIALRGEGETYVSRYRDERDAQGHALVVRNGTARPRPITLGAGTVTLAAPPVNDQRVIAGQRQKF